MAGSTSATPHLKELGDFLRTCRGRLAPADVGLAYRDDKGYWAGQPMTDEQKRKAGWLNDENTPEKQSPLDSPGL